MSGFEKKISEAIARKKVLIKSYLLKEEGEEKLEKIIHSVLHSIGRDDLMGPIYASMRELVQNAAKANMKRVVFEEQGLNPYDEDQYRFGLEAFRKSLASKRVQHYRPILHQRDVPFYIKIKWNGDALYLNVENYFAMLGVEERRIREKFLHSREMDNLYEFFMTYGDSTEGAGMGIAMVQILIRQAGFDAHNFTIFSDNVKNRTSARIVVPLHPAYKTPRQRFEEEQKTRGVSAADLRKEIREGRLELPIFYQL